MNVKIQEQSMIKSSQQVENLFKFTFNHLLKLPKENIQEVVILVSIHDGVEHVFPEITGIQLQKDELKKPNFHRLNQDIGILYPTTAFINSQLAHYFISMHYILNTVKKAKFIFVFKRPDLNQKPIQNIRQTMKRFVSLFPKATAEQLSSSCGYIIYQAQLNRAKGYFNIFSDMYDKNSNYVKDERIKNLCENSMKFENIVLFSSEDKSSRKESFINLVNKLKYFKLPLQVQPSNVSAQGEYRNNKINEKWSNLFKRMYNKLDDLINQCRQPEKIENLYQNRYNIPNRLEQDLCQWPQKVILKQYFEKEWPLKIDFSQKTYRLSSFISSYLQIIGLTTQRSLENYHQNQQIVQKLMKSLYDYGYLSRYSLYIYFVSYFKIYKFYPKHLYQTKMIIQKINFKQIIGDKQIIDQKMTIFINKLYDFLEEEIVNADVGYPFLEIIKQLTNIHEILKAKRYDFATNRTFKKLLKYKAQLAFRRATVVTNAYNIPKSDIIEAWLLFLRYAIQSSLTQSSKIQAALSFFAEQLIKKKQFQLALKVYSNIPEYKSYKKIITIYQRDYKFNIQILKYTLGYDWQNKRRPFQDYCKFLIRIGFYQKVRELCLEGLKVIEDDEEGNQLLISILTSARGDESRDIHIQFLRNLNQEQKIIKIETQLLDAIQKQFKDDRRQKEI